ncbi:MAG: hypothetical protein ACLFTA_01775 [Candidatus Nanohaloarchaea archaeon]
MAQADSGPAEDNPDVEEDVYSSGSVDIDSRLVEGLGIDEYDDVELYSMPGDVSGSADLHVLDPGVDHEDTALKKFAALFSDSDLLVPYSNYYGVAISIPSDTGFQADKHLNARWGCVEDERDKYFLVSDD